MIRTDAEYQAAKKEAGERRARLADYEEKLKAEGLTTEQRQRALDPFRTFALELEDELGRYERLREGDFREIAHLGDVGKILIGLRISKGLTQRALANLLKVSETQVSRDERNEYHGVSVDRVVRILSALRADSSVLLVTSGGLLPRQSYEYSTVGLRCRDSVSAAQNEVFAA